MVRGVKSKPGRPFAGGELVTLRYRLLLRGGVDQRSRFAVMIAGINQIQFLVVNDGVRIDTRGNLLQDPLRIQVEYPDGVVSAVARESEIAAGDDGDAMRAA